MDENKMYQSALFCGHFRYGEKKDKVALTFFTWTGENSNGLLYPSTCIIWDYHGDWSSLSILDEVQLELSYVERKGLIMKSFVDFVKS